MSDILFKCPKCATNLACAVKEVDQMLSCSGCGQPVRVPKPDIAFRCEQCQTDLCAARNAAGEAFACPGCETSLVIPPRTMRHFAVRRPAATQLAGIQSGKPEETEQQASPDATTRRCRKCGGAVAPAAIICSHCGVNLTTGKQYGRHASPYAFSGNYFGFIGILLLLMGLAGGGWYCWKWRQQAATRAANTAKIETRRREREANIEHGRALYYGSTQIELFDVLARIASEANPRLAIDPDAVGAMAHVRVAISDLPAGNDSIALGGFLKKYQLVIRKCPVSDKRDRTVDLVTTESIWAYNHAVYLLQKRQLDQAYQVLQETVIDRSAFGIHCQGLRSLLPSIQNNCEELATLAPQVREAAASCLSDYKLARAAALFARDKFKAPTKRNVPDPDNQAAAERRYEQSLEVLRAAAQHLETFVTKVETDNQAIWMRHLEAHNAQLYTESLALLDILIDNFSILRSLCEEIEKAGQAMCIQPQQTSQRLPWYDQLKMQNIAAISKSLGEMPALFLNRQRTLRESVRSSSEKVASIFLRTGSTTNLVDGLRFANEAFCRDRGNIMARAAAGYFRVHWQAKSARDIFRGNPNRGVARYEELAREFRDNRKKEMLRTALELVGKTNFTMRIDDSGEPKVGTAVGLTVWNAKGVLFPVSARVNLPIPSATETVSDTYWGKIERLARNKLAALPIHFGDYGNKDLSVCMSAMEVYQWLGIAATNRETGLYIEFQDIEFGKAGDAAGITMAVAANSSMSGKGVRQDVAMTGAFRADGSVQPVGGIFEKVDGAVIAPLIEIVLIPTGNEADGLLLPIDKLCRVVIISGANVQTYIKYVAEPDYNRDSLARLRTAQLLILGGQWEQAVSLLLEVAADCPEIYTARRLLELIACWKQTGLTKSTSAGAGPVSPANPATNAPHQPMHPADEKKDAAPVPPVAGTNNQPSIRIGGDLRFSSAT